MKKPVLVTGLSGYVGSALQKVLADSDFEPIAVARDISDSVFVMNEAARIKSQYPNLFGIVHCAAAPLVRKQLLALTDEEFASQLAVNATGAFNLFKQFVPLLIPGSAVIGITTSAVETLGVHSVSGAYLPAKYALKGMLRVLANEQKQLRVYAVAPAFMPGGLNSDMPQGVTDFIMQKSAVGTTTTPDAVAATILNLLIGTDVPESGETILVSNAV